MMARRRAGAASRAAAALALAAVLAALAGCVALPTGGDVSSFDVEREGEGGAVPFLPSGPEAGATQSEILDGFLRAGVGPQESYRVAREFLATDFAARWNPNERVDVTDGSIGEPEQLDADTLVVSIASVATVDASGVYSVLPEASEQELAFEFVEEDGEWRIASAPNVVVLSRSNFSEIFAGFPLYFFDPTGDYLVPDLRWFPSLPTSGERSTTGERVVRSVLDGPVAWLAPAVVSAFAAETQLPAEFLRIADGVATVDLPSQVLAESGAVKRRMLQQLSAALLGIDGVREVALTVGRFPFQIPADETPPTEDPVSGSTLLGLRDGVFGQLGTATVDPLADVGDAVAALAPVAATVSRDRATVALLTADGEAWAVRPGADPQLVDDRDDLIAPSLDPAGFVWTVPADDPTAVHATGPDGEPHELGLAVADPSSTVVSLKVSRDGTRLLVGLATSSGPLLEVVAVARDDTLAPIALGQPLPIPFGAGGRLLDVAWVDSSSVAVLIDQESGPVVRSVAVGGRGAALGGVPGGVQLVGGNGAAGLRALDADGAVRVPPSTGSWPTTGISALFLATQQ